MPVWQLSWYAMKMPFEKAAIFLQMAIVPIAISIVLAVPATLMGRTSTNALTHLAQRGIATALIGLAIALGIKLVVEVPFQVRWLRLAVLGESTPRGRGYFRFDETEKRYLRYELLLLAISIPAVVSCVYFMGQPKGSAASGGGALLFLGLSALTAIVWVRMVFVLPQVATNRFESLAVSWNQTIGIGWRLFAAIASGTLPLAMASAALLECRTSSNGWPISICALAGGVFIDYTSRASMLAVIGIAYRDWGIRVDQAGCESVATVA
jgi:hypothetical protein